MGDHIIEALVVFVATSRKVLAFGRMQRLRCDIVLFEQIGDLPLRDRSFAAIFDPYAVRVRA